MKSFFKKRTLAIAVSLSVLAHVALLLVRFVAPEAMHFKPLDAGLEVILVNAKHASAPLNAQALAQANLDGGGNAQEGRAKSPLPDMRQSVDGTEAQKAKRRIAELEQEQRNLMASLRTKNNFNAAQMKDIDKLRESLLPDGADLLESAKAIARKEAEIAKSIEDYNKRPKKTHITPSTREVSYAAYYKTLQDRIEKYGTLNFPQRDGKKLYGEMVISIQLQPDGSIYAAEGSPRVERSSGIIELDRAALRIVRQAAPFGRFPPRMINDYKIEVWEIITRFRFSRDDTLQAQVGTGEN